MDQNVTKGVFQNEEIFTLFFTLHFFVKTMIFSVKLKFSLQIIVFTFILHDSFHDFYMKLMFLMSIFHLLQLHLKVPNHKGSLLSNLQIIAKMLENYKKYSKCCEYMF